jgi:hypothetical protein
VRTKAIGVVLPVHNEEDLLADALDAIDHAFSQITDTGTECRTVVVLDSCGDASATIARRWARVLGRRGGRHQAMVKRSRAAGVGEARRAGASALLRTWARTDPGNIWLATTDADSRVPGEWLAAQLAAHESGADLWAGRVEVDEWSQYGRSTALRWQASYDREEAPVHGASLGFNAQMYLTVGGFSAVTTGEDRALFRAIIEKGGSLVEDSEVRVITSGRRVARAPKGFAAALTAFDVSPAESMLLEGRGA